ncbi:glycosyltransferase family 4 protein [bacterium]|nr:glycosyltransferase family 4 protein [bacterium]
MNNHLVIISHTEHFKDEEGNVLGWGSTVSELNNLSKHWNKITHIACLHEGVPIKGLMPYTASNFEYVSIPPFGGKSLVQKLSILIKFFTILKIIKPILKKASEVQLRLPTGIGVLLLPWFSFQKRPYKFWVKYAGNWVQKSPPLGYAFQRWWLQKNIAKCPVTINGAWPNQDSHLLTFENPCLTSEDLQEGKAILKVKQYDQPLQFCFVGRIAVNKGITRIISLIRSLDQDQKEYTFHFVGDGPMLAELNDLKQKLNYVKIEIHGFLTRRSTFDIYKMSHIILLPSDSEGFPKVIAEAMNFGCIPIVSDVSCIGQYIKATNGFLWDISTDFTKFFKDQDLSPGQLKSKSMPAHNCAKLYTYDHYYSKIQELLNNRL